jgi:23S rRNA pseudouridine2457 synthase
MGIFLAATNCGRQVVGVLLALNKPYGCLSQFTPEPGSKWRTLADLRLPAKVYPVGRLDADSEGLLLLSDEGEVNRGLLDPIEAHVREYWVQVERVPSETTLGRLDRGVVIGGTKTLPARARLLTDPGLPPRHPPVRFRKTVADAWLALELTEGKNRQVRRMTAAVGHPALRLVRVRIGRLLLADLKLAPGKWCELTASQRRAVFAH